MTLVRHIVFWSLLGNFHIKAQFIPGFTNVIADLISRGNFQKFKKFLQNIPLFPFRGPIQTCPFTVKINTTTFRNTPGTVCEES
jgi:hypothetical protein